MTNFMSLLIVISIIGIIAALLFSDSREYTIRNTSEHTYKEVCLKGYSYYRFNSGYKEALAPVIKDNNFKECGR